jgi:hypothetical protein
MSTAKMGRQGFTLVSKTTEVNNSTHARFSRRRGEVTRAAAVIRFEVARRTHGVNQIISGVDACQCGCQSVSVQHIAVQNVDVT